MATPEDMLADAEHIRMADQFVEVWLLHFGSPLHRGLAKNYAKTVSVALAYTTLLL